MGEQFPSVHDGDCINELDSSKDEVGWGVLHCAVSATDSKRKVFLHAVVPVVHFFLRNLFHIQSLGCVPFGHECSFPDS